MCHEGRTVGSPAAAIGTERLKRRLPNNGASAFARIIVLELRPCFLCRLFCHRNICPHLPGKTRKQPAHSHIDPSKPWAKSSACVFASFSHRSQLQISHDQYTNATSGTIAGSLCVGRRHDFVGIVACAALGAQDGLVTEAGDQGVGLFGQWSAVLSKNTGTRGAT